MSDEIGPAQHEQSGRIDVDLCRRVSYALPPMHQHIYKTLCAAIAVWACLPAWGDDLSLTPREGVVLLTNGELIAGKIIPAGDRYDIHLPSGEICLRRSDVALICRDADECYRHKRADIEIGRAQDHLDLAEWCIRNNLFDAAQREIADARRADPVHPKLRLVASRLELAKVPIPEEPASDVVRTVAHVPLDSLARNLPSGTMETFTHTVQPLLLNYCSKSGCHASRDDGGLKLERIHPRISGRSTTQRNLEQVLALIDRENPPASKLLQAPIRPHGPLTTPIFTDREHGQYRQLVLWAYAVAGTRSPVAKPTLAERTAPLLQSIPGATGEVPADASAPPLASDFAEELPSPEGSDEPAELPASSAEQAFTPEELRSMGIDPFAPAPNLNVGKAPQRGAKLPAAFTPRDEFDPEIFNRRFFSR